MSRLEHLLDGVSGPDGPDGTEVQYRTTDPDHIPTWAADDEVIRADVIREARRIAKSTPHRYQAGWAGCAAWMCEAAGVPLSLAEIVGIMEAARG